jgi:type I restriction enzyme, S subunit
MTPNDVKIVAENINDFIEVPDGINRLRKAVLALAVSGQLVEQYENEGTAEDLYTQIQVERAEFDISRRKKVRVLNPITDDEVPFDLPHTWRWVRIREITHDYGQKTPDKEFYYVDVSSINSSKGEVVEPKLIKPSEASSRARKIVQDGSVIYSGIRPYLLNTALVNPSEYDREVIVSTAFFVLKPFGNISSDYVHLIVRSPYFDQLANQACVGAAYPAINDDKFEKLPFPLPPLSEQERIVRRVNEVMKQLDELESQKKERDLVRSRLTRSVMQALGSADSKISFEQLTELIKTPQDIKELENALLTLAISGNLVLQNETEGTAEQLYAQIKAEREKLGEIGARKKKSNELLSILDEEIPFDIPKSWKWVRIGEVGTVKGGKRLPKGSGFVERVTEHPYIRITDMKNGSVNISSVPYVSKEVFEKISRYTISSKDIYVTIAGTIGDAGKIPEELDGANLTENAAKIEFKSIDLNYFVLVLRSAFVKNQFLQKVVQMAQPKLALHRIESSVVPLPPLAEQKRIVKKVEELMLLVNELKKLIN